MPPKQKASSSRRSSRRSSGRCSRRKGVIPSPVEQPVDDANNNGKGIARIPNDVNGRARHSESNNIAVGKCIMDELSSSDDDDDTLLLSPGKYPEPTHPSA